MPDYSDTRLRATTPLSTPQALKNTLPTPEILTTQINTTRQSIQHILHGQDSRLLVIVGPCSIHDPIAALEYAQRLNQLRARYQSSLNIIMRAYFEKPRTAIGWKGLINDPDLDGSFHIEKGLKLARQLLLDINQLGQPIGTEFLDLTTPAYLSDLVSWAAIGARTTESQLHRDLASGLSMPVGFKNATSGHINVACDALLAASHSHYYLGINQQGQASVVETSGNPDTHVILRGGHDTGPNYNSTTVTRVSAHLQSRQLCHRLMIDCSHGNSGKDHHNQPQVINAVCEQIKQKQPIMGVMLESNLVAGKQALTPKLIYGQSITDACIDWDTTERLIEQLANTLQQRI